ncbi:type-1 angiotensin II receptor-associated protein [Sigmodon hispidus]
MICYLKNCLLCREGKSDRSPVQTSCGPRTAGRGYKRPHSGSQVICSPRRLTLEPSRRKELWEGRAAQGGDLLADRVSLHRACLVFSGSYAWSNFTILALGVWAVAQRDSIDAIGLFLGGLVATIFLDIIYISIFYPVLAIGNTGRFSAGMAILSLLLKPFSCCLVYHMHRERGGELPLRPDFFGPPQEHSAYQTIDSSDSPAAPFANLEDKGQAAPRGY